MSFTEHQGDLFTSTAEVIGHGVNTRGLMGAGIAAAFRSRYPDMYREYRALCVEGLLEPGEMFPYQVGEGLTVVNIASQEHPGPDAKLSWLLGGLIAAASYMMQRELTTLALPRIGCGIGGLDWESEVRPLLEGFADECVPAGIRIEVWSL